MSVAVDSPDAPPTAERWLWVVAVLTYGVGDTATTLVGLESGSVAEAGPVAGSLIGAYGAPGFLLLKLCTLALFFAAWYALRSPSRAAVPLAVAVAGTLITAWNLFVLVSATPAL